MIIYIAIFYAGLLLWLYFGYVLSLKEKLKAEASKISVSILISARHEAQNIEACLQSIIQQDYPKSLIEIILIDDASVDKTAEIAQAILERSGIQFRLIKNERHLGKKQSLQSAIPLAIHTLIITRDADTWTASNNWLRSITQCVLQNKADVIIAPISIADEGGLLNGLQSTENQVLRIISAGSTFFGFPFLNSGANFAFTKATFEKLHGYTSHLQLASGEDVFFLQAAAKDKSLKIMFLKSASALVYTYSAKTWKSLLAQRARWSGKILKRPSFFPLTLGLLNLLSNALFIYALVAIIFAPERILVLYLVFKLGIDFFLLFLGPGCFEKRKRKWSLLPICLIYPFYALLVGFAGLLTKPRWK